MTIMNEIVGESGTQTGEGCLMALAAVGVLAMFAVAVLAVVAVLA